MLAVVVATTPVWQPRGAVFPVSTLAGEATRRVGGSTCPLPGGSGRRGGGMAQIACSPRFNQSAGGRDLAGDRDGVVVRRHRPPCDRSTQPRGFVADRNRGRHQSRLSDERVLPLLPESDLF